jgi:hypothetical protein
MTDSPSGLSLEHHVKEVRLFFKEYSTKRGEKTTKIKAAMN